MSEEAHAMYAVSLLREVLSQIEHLPGCSRETMHQQATYGTSLKEK
jgi:hypothetical protein